MASYVSYPVTDGTNRDVTPNRALNQRNRMIAPVGPTIVQALALQTMPVMSTFYPVAGAVYAFTGVSAAGATITITDANLTQPLPFNLKSGEGFSFTVQNVGTGQVITLAVGGNVTSSGTLTVANNTARVFNIVRGNNTTSSVNGAVTASHVLTGVSSTTL